MKHIRATAVLVAASAAFVVGGGAPAHAQEAPVKLPAIDFPALPGVGDAAPKAEDGSQKFDLKGLDLLNLPLIGDLLGLTKK